MGKIRGSGVLTEFWGKDGDIADRLPLDEQLPVGEHEVRIPGHLFAPDIKTFR